MKISFITLLLFVFAVSATAQNIAINNSGINPDSSAILDISSATKGLLLPRMTSSQVSSLVNPAKGLMVYDSVLNQLMVNMGSSQIPSWQTIVFNSGWNLTGNAATSASGNFIGTTDAAPLVFKINKMRSGLIDSVKANTSLGFRSLDSITAGVYNVAVGYGAMTSSTLASYNIAIGGFALGKNKDGAYNNAVGLNALSQNSSGSNNNAFGDQALYSNTTGYENVALGSWALLNNKTGIFNIAVGTSALLSNVSGSSNIGIGYAALHKSTSGYSNTAIGHQALRFSTVQNNLVAIGDSALFWNGFGALNSYDATGNTAVGSKSMYSNTTGYYNAGFGSGSLFYNTTGYYNTAMGFSSMISNTGGHENTAVGMAALHDNNSGYANVAVGTRAMQSNTSGQQNTGYGFAALFSNNTGSYNTATGAAALNYSTGSENTADGAYALYTNTTGSANTVQGKEAMYYNTAGNNNVAIGYRAMYNNTAGYGNISVGMASGNSVPTGNTYCIFMGYNSGVAPTATTSLTNAIAIGLNTGVDADNKVRIGNTSMTSIGGHVGWSTLSDGRFKRNIKEDVVGIEFIKKLRPVTYTVDLHDLNARMGMPDSIARQMDYSNENTRYTGFLAQEVEKASQELNFNFSAVDKPQNPKGQYGLRYAEFVVPLVKAIQEQQLQIEMLKKENQALKTMQADIEALKKILNDKKN